MGTNAEGPEELVRARIRSGKIPIAGQYRLFGGRGDGGLCSCCDRIISRSEMAFEVDCPLNDKHVTLQVHLACFNFWINESRAYRLEKEAKKRDPHPGGPSHLLRT